MSCRKRCDIRKRHRANSEHLSLKRLQSRSRPTFSVEPTCQKIETADDGRMD